MDQSQAGGGYDPSQYGDGSWDGSFIDPGQYAFTFGDGMEGNVGGYGGNPSPIDHQTLANVPVDHAYGGFQTPYQQQQIQPGYSNGSLHFDRGYPSNVSAGDNAMAQGAYSAGHPSSFTASQNSYSQALPTQQSQWHDHGNVQAANGYGDQSQYLHVVQQPVLPPQLHSQQQSSRQLAQQQVTTQPQQQQLPQSIGVQPAQQRMMVQQQVPKDSQHQQLSQQHFLHDPHVQQSAQSPLPQQIGHSPTAKRQYAQQQPHQPQHSEPHPSQAFPTQPPSISQTSQRAPQQLAEQPVTQLARPMQVSPQLLQQPASNLAAQTGPGTQPLRKDSAVTPSINNGANQGQKPHHYSAPISGDTVRSIENARVASQRHLVVNEEFKQLGKNGHPAWVGAAYLVVGSKSEPREKITKQQMIPVYVKSSKKRLFPQKTFSIPAESLGRHIEGYIASARDSPETAQAKHALLDSILEKDLRWSGHKKPEKWMAKVEIKVKEESKRYSSIQTNPLSAVSERMSQLERETATILSIPTSWEPTPALLSITVDEFCDLLKEKVSELRKSASYKALPTAIKERKSKAGSSTAADKKISDIKLELAPLRKAVEEIIVTALEIGHAKVLEMVGDVMAGGSLFQLVINGINTGETNSSLVKAVLQLFTRFSSLTSAQLETARFSAAQTRLQEQGDEGVKSAIEKILEIAKGNDGKQPPKSAKASPHKTATSKMAEKEVKEKTVPKAAAGVVASKRPREDDTEARTIKKVATGTKAANSPAEVKAATAKTASSAPQSSAATVAKSRPSTGLLPGKSRPVAKPAAKPDATKVEITKIEPAKAPSKKVTSASNLAQPSLEPSESKSVAHKIPLADEPEKLPKARKVDPPKAETAQPAQSRFAALMDEISKPKEARPPSPTPTPAPQLPETPEERDRRIRKEKRRSLNLRVSWKEGDELASVRVFHKEASEDEGREVNMTRDANDDRAEGKLLKQSRSGEIRPWEEPTLVDLSVIPQEQRQRTFTTRGGLNSFHTEQQKLMEERERTVIMAFYTDPDDIPPTPKSPPPETMGIAGSPGIAPPQGDLWNEFSQRAQDTLRSGPAEAVYQIFQRLERKKNPGAIPHSKAMEIIKRARNIANTTNGLSTKGLDHYTSQETRQTKDQMVFNLLSGEHVKKWVDPEPYSIANPKTVRRHDYPDPRIQAAADAIESVAEQLKGQPAVPQQPPQWLQDPKRVDEWWQGFNRDKQQEDDRRQQEAAQLAANSAAQAHNYGQYHAQMNPVQQQQAYAQYYAAMAQHVNPQQSMNSNSQLNATLAAIAAASSQAQQPTPGSDAAGQVQALLATLQQSQQPQSGAPAIPNPQDPVQAAYMMQLAQWAAGQPGQPGHIQNPAGTGTTQSYVGSQDASHGSNNLDYNQLQYQRDRQDQGSRSAGGNRGRDRGGRRGQNGNEEDIPEHLRGINRALIGTKQCAFWVRGQCNKGDKCTFRHE